MNRDIRNALIGLVVALILLVPAVWGYFSGWGHEWGMMPGMMSGFGWGVFTILGVVFFWGLVIGGVILLVRGIVSAGSRKKEASGLEILKQRYARGEIGKEEFDELGRDLRSGDEATGRPLPKKRKTVVFTLSVIAVLIAGVAGVIFLNRPEQKTDVAQPIVLLGTADYHTLVFSANDSNVVFFGHHDGLMRSNDGGTTWQSSIHSPNFDVMSLAVARNGSGNLMYMAGHLILRVSRDGGSNWAPIKNNLPHTDIHGFAVSPEDPKRLFAFVYRKGFYRSTDGGSNWEQLSTQLPADIMVVAASGEAPETLYAGSMRAGVFRSTNGGITWTPAGGKISGSVMAIAVDYREPRTVYAGGNTGLYKSSDGGNSWRKLSFPGNNVAALAVSPVQPGLLLAINVVKGIGEVYRSEDGGMTWGE